MASTLFAWGESLLYLVPGLVIVNLRFAGEGLAVYPLSVWLGMLVGCPLLALLFASSGVIVSLRSATVRQAQLILSLFFFVPAFLPMFLTLLPRDVARRLLDDLRTWDITLLILIVSALLLALDIAVTRLAMQRFRRTRLVLDG
jgi:ABC-2 type transport system permease protein